MYSPTTRLLTVLELLQSYQQMSGRELARRLEVDPRTVRRYIAMLQDMGIPVEGERGPYGAYQLGRGFKLPPLMYTDEEAIAITLGLIIMRAYRVPAAVAAVEGALAKTERVLPENLFRQVRGLQEAIQFNVTPSATFRQTDILAILSAAVRGQTQVNLRYQSFQGADTEREFDPYGIVFNEGYWYTAGYCHLRQDLRTFRLDRVVGLEALDTRFERPTDFDAMGYVLNTVVVMPGTAQVEVFLETTLEHAQAVISPALGTLEAVENGVMLRRSATQLEWLAHMLLIVDFPVRVIETPELRDRLRELGQRALQIAERT
jgi:predicted DNA-binding transcriptional regulator YafY